MKSDWDERNKYCDPFIEWNEYKEQKAYREADRLSEAKKENEIKESTKEN